MQPSTPRAKGKQSDPNTPQRRSLYDLQKLIDEVFDEHNSGSGSTVTDNSAGDDDDVDGPRTCKARDLLAILSAFESRRQLILLDDEQKAMITAFSEQNPDLAVSSEQLVNVLALMTAQSNSNSSSTSPSPAVHLSTTYEKQLPTPPPSDNELEVPKESRSRSSSNSSRSSSSRSSNMLTGSGTLDETVDTSASLFDTEPPSTCFPRSQSMPEGVQQQLKITSPPGTPIANMFQRSHTLQDLNIKGGEGSGSGSGIPRPAAVGLQHARAKTHQQHTPLSASISARQRSSPLEAQQDNVLRRSRPAPPKSRRISTDKDRYGSIPASGSSGSIASSADGRVGGSGGRSRQSSDEFALSPRSVSPRDDLTSPLFGSSLDSMPEEGQSSFDDIAAYQRARKISGGSSRGGLREPSPLFDTSPPPSQMAHAGASMFPPHSPLLDDTSFHSVPISPHELKQASDDFGISVHHRIMGRPVSTASLGSDAALLEQLQAMEQEMARRARDNEAKEADTYARMLEMQSKMEDIMSELAQSRKNEKELKGREKIRLDQVATAEAQAVAFKDDRDKQKAAYQNMREKFEDQCAETEKFRNDFRAKSEDMRLREEAFQNLNSDMAKLTQERDYWLDKCNVLMAEIAELKKELEAADEQRTEILLLKETIDRLRLELDEARAQRQAGSSSLSRSASGTESMPSTLSRNLGRELARRAAGETVEEGDDMAEKTEAESDSRYEEEEEVVTVVRRLKRPTKLRSGTLTMDTKDSFAGDTKQSMMMEVCDVGVQANLTDDGDSHARQEENELVQMTPEQRRTLLANELSVDLDAVDEYIRVRDERARLASAVPDSAPPPYHDVPAAHISKLQPLVEKLPRDAQALLELAVRSSSHFLLYSALLFIAGLLAHATMGPARHQHHIASYDPYVNWAAYNSLEFEPVGHFGWKSNALWWIERWAWRGVALSRRVPT